MADIEQLREKIALDQFEFSKHALDRSILRHILLEEVRECFETGDVIEDYPNDHYGPSCLVAGFTQAGRPLHVQCSYPTRPLLKIITLYEPDPSQWVDFKIRKP
jgi:Domain of unknown function (DUF4258)